MAGLPSRRALRPAASTIFHSNADRVSASSARCSKIVLMSPSSMTPAEVVLDHAVAGERQRCFARPLWPFSAGAVRDSEKRLPVVSGAIVETIRHGDAQRAVAHGDQIIRRPPDALTLQVRQVAGTHDTKTRHLLVRPLPLERHLDGPIGQGARQLADHGQDLRCPSREQLRF